MRQSEFDCQLETYLSPNVHRLLCHTAICDQCLSAGDQMSCFTHGLLNWSAFSSEFSSALLSTYEEHEKWVKQMAPLFMVIHNFYNKLPMEDFKLKLVNCAAWTAQQSSVLQCFALHNETIAFNLTNV